MATMIERYDSREATEGVESPSVDLIYMVTGTEDDLVVRGLVETTIPAIYLGLVFQTYHIAHQGGGVWEVSVRYGKQEPRDTGDSSFSFDTGGGTTHITQSLATIGSYAPPGKTAPNFQGAIGVTTDSVEGTDITVPIYHFTETHYIPISQVTPGYKTTLFVLTGRVNAGVFKGFAAGEVLFLGASGSQRGQDDWEITFRFAASPNVSGLAVGPITGISNAAGNISGCATPMRKISTCSSNSRSPPTWKRFIPTAISRDWESERSRWAMPGKKCRPVSGWRFRPKPTTRSSTRCVPSDRSSTTLRSSRATSGDRRASSGFVIRRAATSRATVSWPCVVP